MASAASLSRPAVRADLSYQQSHQVPTCGARVKILMVDDQPSNLLALEAVLAAERAGLVNAGRLTQENVADQS